MILVPRMRFEGRTSLSQESVSGRMRGFIEAPPAVSRVIAVLQMGERRYSGSVDTNSFRLTLKSRFKHAYVPHVLGEFVSEAKGTRVRGVMSASAVEMAAMGGAAVLGPVLFDSAVVLELAVAAHVVGYLFGFLPHKRTFETWLTSLPEWEWGAAEQVHAADEARVL